MTDYSIYFYPIPMEDAKIVENGRLLNCVTQAERKMSSSSFIPQPSDVSHTCWLLLFRFLGCGSERTGSPEWGDNCACNPPLHTITKRCSTKFSALKHAVMMDTKSGPGVVLAFLSHLMKNLFLHLSRKQVSPLCNQ